METNSSSRSIHPLVATAAVALTVLSLTGVAAITGLLPTSHSTNGPTASAQDNDSVAAAEKSKLDDSKLSKSSTAEKSDKAEKSVRQPARVAGSSSGSESSAPANPDYAQRVPQSARATYCDNCGRIESVEAVAQAAQPSGLGIAAGAVIGGLLGNQVGDGSGRKIATVAGAVGGGFAGNEVEKRTRTTTTYEVRVRMEDGSIRTIPQSSSYGWQAGDRVKVVNGSLVSNS